MPVYDFSHNPSLANLTSTLFRILGLSITLNREGTHGITRLTLWRTKLELEISGDGVILSFGSQTLKERGGNQVGMAGTAGGDALLRSEIIAGRPVILYLGDIGGGRTHFVVATGILTSANTFAINDSGFPDRATLLNYSGSYENSRLFRPAGTELSFLTLYGDADLDFLLVSPSGKMVGFDSSSGKVLTELAGSAYRIELPLDDDIDHVESSGDPAKILEIPHPEIGDYSLSVFASSTGEYRLTLYSLDSDANITVIETPGAARSGEIDNFKISYTGELGVSAEFSRTPTLQELGLDIKAYSSLGLITKEGIAISLIKKLAAAESAVGRDQFDVARRILFAFRNEVIALPDNQINTRARKVLIEGANHLLQPGVLEGQS